eukprot:g4686.t1
MTEAFPTAAAKKTKKKKKSAPMEVSSKKPVSRFREVVKGGKRKHFGKLDCSRFVAADVDPRFSDLCGTLRDDLYSQSYGFISDLKKNEAERIRKELKKTRDPEAAADLKKELSSRQNDLTLEARKKRTQELRRKKNKSEREAVAKGEKKAFYEKKSEKHAEDDTAFMEGLFGADTNDEIYGEGIVCAFVGSAMTRVDRMLEMLPELGADDTVVDMGCGDGRVLIRVCQARGATCKGYDLQMQCIDAAREAAAEAGLPEERLSFEHTDLRDADYSRATYVVVYLDWECMKGLVPFEELLGGFAGLKVVTFRRPLETVTWPLLSSDKEFGVYVYEVADRAEKDQPVAIADTPFPAAVESFVTALANASFPKACPTSREVCEGKGVSWAYAVGIGPSKIDYRAEDATVLDKPTFEDGDVVLCNNLVFDDELNARLARKAELMRPGSVFLSPVVLPSDEFLTYECSKAYFGVDDITDLCENDVWVQVRRGFNT